MKNIFFSLTMKTLILNPLMTLKVFMNQKKKKKTNYLDVVKGMPTDSLILFLYQSNPPGSYKHRCQLLS